MRRRALLSAMAAALAMPRIALGQAKGVARVGLLWLGAPEVDHLRKALLDGLRDQGYVEGRNLAIEDATARRYEDLPDGAKRLVERKVDVIVTWGFTSLTAARRATSSIPIVMNAGIDPVKSGFAASLARPGGNVTGISTINIELQGKQAQLVRETLPRARRVSAIGDPVSGMQLGYFALVEAEARRIGIEFKPVEVRNAADLESAFAAAAGAKMDAVYIIPSTMLQTHSGLIGALALKHRLPSFAYAAEYADAGVLLTYGVNRAAAFHRTAGYIARILKGASPAGMPIERPAEFELVVNRITARALGVTIPPAVLVRATRIID